MKNFFKNTDLNINSWLINWGYMNGYLKDGQIHTTKYYVINQLMVIMIVLFNVVRFLILLFSPKESQASLILGDWSQFLGPRVMINGIIFFGFFSMLMLIAYFKFCDRNPQKIFYWLSIMDYDSETRCYYNLNLNESDSKMFIKRSLIFINALNCFAIVFLLSFLIVISVSIFIHSGDYYLNQLITLLVFFLMLYHALAYAYGLPIILYLVSINLVMRYSIILTFVFRFVFISNWNFIISISKQSSYLIQNWILKSKHEEFICWLKNTMTFALCCIVLTIFGKLLWFSFSHFTLCLSGHWLILLLFIQTLVYFKDYLCGLL